MKKHLHEKWKDYESHCVPEEACQTQREDMHDAFFYGATNLYDILQRVSGNSPKETQANGRKLMIEIHQELIKFQDDVMQQHEERKAAADDAPMKGTH